MNNKDDAPALARMACDKLRSILGANLVTFALYGSSVRQDGPRTGSDVNVLIVLERSSPEAHRAIADALAEHGRIAPFVLSRWELPRSRSAFALKFCSIARHHEILYGEDLISGFSPPDSLVQFLCEQSLRNLRLRLKHAYIRNVKAPDRYAEALARATPSLFVALSQVLRSGGAEAPADHGARPEAIGRFLETDASVLSDLRLLRAKPRKLDAAEAFQFHSRLFSLLSRTLDWVREQWPNPTTPA